MAASEADVAAKLIERLLADPAFRARFRRDPAGACREAGLEELAQEMSLGAGKAMHTLDMRESKSSLAGVMMAAAMEGVGIYELTENVLPHLEQVPGHIADVLSRVDLPAIHHGGGGAAAHAGGGAAAGAAPSPANGGGVADAGSSVPTPPAASIDQHADAGGTAPAAGAGAAGAGSADPAASGGEAAGGGAAGTGSADAAASRGGAAGASPAAGGGSADSAAAAGASSSAGRGGSGAAADAATGRARGGSRAAAPPEVARGKSSAARKAAKKIAESLSPRAAHKQAASDAAAALDTQTKGLPESSDLPTGDPTAAAGSGGAADAAASAGAPPPTPDAGAAAVPGGGEATLPDSSPASLQATDATAPPEAIHHAAAAVADAPHAAAAHHGIDPSQFGQGGTGGHPDPEALALLHNRNVILDAHGIADIQAGRVDPRVVGVLTKLSQEHKLTISAIASDHPRFTTGGSVSNHYLGRGVDIAAIDGHIVDAGNPIARELASELSSLEPGIRPNEIGSPWAISGPGYFTDAAHHNHLHIGFKQPIPPGWRPPADVAAPGDAAATAGAGADKAAAAGAASGGTAATAGASAGQPVSAGAGDAAATGGSGAGQAVAPPEAAPPAVAPPATAGAAAASGAPPPSAARGSLAFLQALDPKSQAPAHGQSQAFLQAIHPQQAAVAPPAGTPVADAAAAGSPGGAADAAAAFTDTTYPGDNASQAQIAAWMAAEAQKRGLPPQLPVMASLVESGVKNLNFGDRDSVGFFQMRVGTWNSGPYAGFPDKPELQIKWFLDQAEAVKAQRIARGQSVTDPHQYGDWIADIERPAEQYRGRYQLRLDEADGLLAQHAGAAPAGAAAAVAPAPGEATVTPGGAAVSGAGAVTDAAGAVTPPTPGGGGGLGAAALQVAETQKGVREIGSTNTGPQVDHYLQAAGVPPGNPWCASFVTWSLQQTGHKMPGGGWAAVSTWVRNAEAGTNGLKIVSADQAQPGDIVAYDWGGGTDFSADGHIGFLASNVNNGQFNALEGNNADAVNLVPRHLGGGPNIVFIHVEGNTPAGATAAAADTPAAGAQAATVGATGAAPPAEPAPSAARGSLAFLQALDPKSQAPAHGQSQAFLQAIHPQQAAVAPPAGTPVADAAAAGSPGGAADAAAAFTDTTYPGDNASQAQIAAWMAAEAQKRGLPPQLPVMASLVESGVKNLNFGDRDSVGFFQMRVGTWNSGPYAGFPDKPELQIKWFLDQAEAVKAQRIARGQSVTDPHQYGDWIADIERPAEQYRGRYQLRLDEADGLLAQHAGAAPAGAAAAVAPAPGEATVTPGGAAVSGAGAVTDAAGAVTPPTPGGGGGLGAAALQVAETQKGVREIGSTNTGPQVDHYLQAAGVPPGNPWCASFVTWSLQQTGHKMPGGGWAAVSTWVRNAEAGTNGLKIVSADQAQPGDIVAYDWGGGTDFSADGHIGFLASNVNNGQFNALEGNNADAVNLVPRHLGGGPNIVFIHVEGNTPAGATAAAADTPAAAAATTPPVAEAADAGAPAPGPGPEPVKHDSMMFQALVKQDQPKGRRASAMFLKAIDPSQQVKPAADAAAAPAPPTSVPPAATPPEVATPAAATPADATAPAGAAPDAHVAAASVDLASAASGYPGDNASQAQLARWLGDQAQKAGLPRELPVMASLVESGVKNVHFGDRDSVGFFQMRVGIWNQGAYAGFPDRPELQAKWFIDNALAVKRRAIAAGDANFGQDPSKFGEWIADVERPAEQYRGRYQLRLDEARGLLGG